MLKNPVLKSIKPVVYQSKYVNINKKAIKSFCKNLDFCKLKKQIDRTSVELKLGSLGLGQKMNFLFVINSINFCYWGDPKWRILYKGKTYDGALGLLKAFQKAIERNIPITDTNYLVNLPRIDLLNILKGNVLIPLFDERWRILKENGRILSQKYNGEFINLLIKSDYNALKLLKILTKDFPSFNDFSIYNKKKVFFYKRAQLLIADIYREFRDKYKFKNIHKLTAFADYKIPCVLRKLKVLEYSDELSEKIDKYIQIPFGSEEEIEIRANTIFAVELIKRELKSKIPFIKSIDIDAYLWRLGREKFKNQKHHLTKTIFY